MKPWPPLLTLQHSAPRCWGSFPTVTNVSDPQSNWSRCTHFTPEHQTIGLLMVHLVVVKTHRIRPIGAIPTKMTHMSTTETSSACIPTSSVMGPPTLGTMALALMASQTWIPSPRPLYLPHWNLNLLWLPVSEVLQINLMLSTSRNHMILGLALWETHKLHDVIPPHVMIPYLLYLLVRWVLRNHQSSLPRLCSDLCHCFSHLVKVLKLLHQLLHLQLVKTHP